MLLCLDDAGLVRRGLAVRKADEEAAEGPDLRGRGALEISRDRPEISVEMRGGGASRDLGNTSRRTSIRWS